MIAECPTCASQDLIEVDGGIYLCNRCSAEIAPEDVVWVDEEGGDDGG
jgi:ribosomal protein L37AE/L43A